MFEPLLVRIWPSNMLGIFHVDKLIRINELVIPISGFRSFCLRTLVPESFEEHAFDFSLQEGGSVQGLESVFLDNA